MDTCIDKIPNGCKSVHESCLRASQILEKVKYWLKKGVPQDIILELIHDIESGNKKNA